MAIRTESLSVSRHGATAAAAHDNGEIFISKANESLLVVAAKLGHLPLSKWQHIQGLCSVEQRERINNARLAGEKADNRATAAAAEFYDKTERAEFLDSSSGKVSARERVKRAAMEYLGSYGLEVSERAQLRRIIAVNERIEVSAPCADTSEAQGAIMAQLM